MSPAFAGYAIVGWLILVTAVFASLSPRAGVITILLSGTLFLPSNLVGVVEFGPIKFSKDNAICYALLLTCLLYDSKRLLTFMPSWADLPLAVWCLCPGISAFLNDLPPDGSSTARDAASQVFAQTILYAVPYVIGCVYFSDPDGMRTLVSGIVAAALLYVPLCLYEVRMSPQLHATVYGYTPSDFAQQVRFGGYRPVVFMSHGLAVAFFMASGTVLAVWVRGRAAEGRGWCNWGVWVLGPMTVLCKSVGAILLAAVGLLILLMARASAARVGLLVLVAVPPVYCIARSAGGWRGAELVQLTVDNINEERAESLEFRLEQENLLVTRALERPAFGWGGWGRNRLKNEEGHDVCVTDSLWIIFLGTYGFVGLTAYGVMMLLPVVRYALVLPATEWRGALYAGASGCAIVIGLGGVDSLFNATTSTLLVVMAGGLIRMRLTSGTAAQ